MEKNKKNIIDECYLRSVELLLKNANKYGVMAATPSKKATRVQYDNIFGRDASISSLGMIISGNKKLLSIAKRSILSLAKHQSKFGQISFSINPTQKENLFFYNGCIDSTLWWLIAVDFYNKHSDDKNLYNKLQPKIKLALNWLFCQDQNNCGLLEQGEASDWADMMPSNGAVLYTNVLWVKVLDCYGFKKEKKLALDGLNTIFWPQLAKPNNSDYLKKEFYRLDIFKKIKKEIKVKDYYLNYISRYSGNERFDSYGNILAILFNIADKNKSDKIINFILKNKINKPFSTKVLYPVIKEKDKEWRDYMKFEDLNYPHQYHNGGSWPYVGSFWSMAVNKRAINHAWLELEEVAKANRINNWEFNEWFHGKSGRAMGMKGQSWNAGTYILAYHYLKKDFSF
jgi:hypothetical protein